MSEENVRRFLKATEAFNRGDVEAWMGFYDPDAVFEPQVAAIEGAAVGHEGVRAFITDIGDLYESFRVDIEEVQDHGDRLLALGTATGVGKGSGIEQQTPLAIVVTFRNGQITHFKDYGDKSQALEAAGLSEQAMSEENVELVRAGYDAFNRGDIEWLLERTSPGIEFNTRAEAPDLPRVIRGKEGIRQLFNEWFVGPWEGGLRQDVERIHDLGDDRVLGLVTFRGRGKGSGIEVEVRYAHIFTLGKGIVTHIEGFPSWEKALEAAGLTE